MAESYKLTAIPHLLTEEFPGHLQTVTFIATDGVDTHKWFSTNGGTFERDFGAIVGPDEAKAFVNQLRAGETVYFPGSYDLEKILYKFGVASND